jgi:hypothetical protein
LCECERSTDVGEKWNDPLDLTVPLDTASPELDVYFIPTADRRTQLLRYFVFNTFGLIHKAVESVLIYVRTPKLLVAYFTFKCEDPRIT